MSDLGYVEVDRITLQRATEAREADMCSAVVRHAKIENAADRARRLAKRERPAIVLPWRRNG